MPTWEKDRKTTTELNVSIQFLPFGVVLIRFLLAESVCLEAERGDDRDGRDGQEGSMAHMANWIKVDTWSYTTTQIYTDCMRFKILDVFGCLPFGLV